MFCPECKYEYVDGVKRCPDCDVELVAELPEDESEELDGREMVTVFIPEDISQLMIARSLLEDAGIPYFVKNEISQNLFAFGQAGVGYNPLNGPEILVQNSYENEARRLLTEVPEAADVDFEEVEWADEEPVDEE